MDQLSALVEEVAHGHRQVLLALGHRHVLQRPERALDDFVLGVLGQPVVAEVPDDRVVVTENAQIVGHALGVDVPQVGVVAGGLDCRQVFIRVLRRRHAGRVLRVHTGVVLVGDDQHAGAGVASDR